jgi:signal transduction histidine kinase
MRLQLQKEQLMSFVVHDLKNPVNCIDLLAQALVRRKDTPADAKENAHLIRDEVRSLMLLILNLLDISKSEEGQLHPNLVTLNAAKFLGDLLESLDVRARAKSMTLVGEFSDFQFHADPDLLRRILENLIENAIRHAPGGSKVTIDAERHTQHVELRISDQGPGIPEELRSKIFERFVQLELPATARTGRGLGLTFCKLAIEAHGGEISVEDGAPGAVFRIRLPA